MEEFTNMYSLSLDEYKSYIHYIVNRVIKDNLFIIEKKRINNKLIILIKMKRVEWYLELEDDVKCDVEENLKRHIIRQIQSAGEFEGLNTTIFDNNDNDTSNNNGTNRILEENDNHKNKRQRVNI